MEDSKGKEPSSDYLGGINGFLTGGAIDNKEGEPGSIMLQGDHRPADYRNIIITTAK